MRIYAMWVSAVCLLALSAAGAQPLPTGEFLIDTSGVHQQQYPGGAAGSEGYLVVWQDLRRGVADICAARVGSSGAVLDPAGFVVSAAPYGQFRPAAAFDGINYLVVWTDGRGSTGYDIYAARVSPAGVVLDSGGIPVSTADDQQHYPAVVFDGSNYLVAWTDWRNGFYSDIYAARVTPAGNVLDPAGLPVCTANSDQLEVALACDGTNCLAVWEDLRNPTHNDIYAARISPDGAVLDPQGFLVNNQQFRQGSPAVAFDGTNYFVTWEDARSIAMYDVYGGRVSPYGEVLDSAGIPLVILDENQWAPALCFDGANHLAVWGDERSGTSADIYGCRVSRNGVVFDPTLIVEQDGNQLWPAVVHLSGGSALLVYQGWTGTAGGKTYNTYRVWGKMNPASAVAERQQESVANRREPTATILRGVLWLADAGQSQCIGRTGLRDSPCAVLLDAAGRKIVSLQPGPNDVSRLAPGVYFILQAPGVARDASGVERVSKVVVTK